MTEFYQPKYQWSPTWPDDIKPGAPVFDFRAHDGDEYAGRIFKVLAGADTGRWLWAGAHPHGFTGNPLMPNSGSEKTARLAIQKCEVYWDVMKSSRPRLFSPCHPSLLAGSGTKWSATAGASLHGND